MAEQLKSGRPLGRRPLLNLRVNSLLIKQIKAAAKVSGRTVSEEAVYLIQFAIDRQALLNQANCADINKIRAAKQN